MASPAFLSSHVFYDDSGPGMVVFYDDSGPGMIVCVWREILPTHYHLLPSSPWGKELEAMWIEGSVMLALGLHPWEGMAS